MIAKTHDIRQSERWQAELAEGFRSPADLLEWLGLGARDIEADVDLQNPFPMRVPLGYARRMRRGDAADPLLRQVLPLTIERATSPDYSADPVGDLAALRSPGLLQKYQGRALVVTTGACAIHCRYCFRRHFPYGEMDSGDRLARETAHAVALDPSIREVILSGGDPLAVSTRQLTMLIRAIEAVTHVVRLRIHTRLPIVLPSRIDDELADVLSNTRLRAVCVVHANHSNEIDEEVRRALNQLREAGVALFNQSVLLRGVNDDVRVLASLSETLFDAGVTPYYLHLLDRVQGAAHFDVGIDTARRLHRELRDSLPGYLVPRLVREEAGLPAKQLIY